MKGMTGYRLCIACRKYARQSELIRVMRTEGGLLILPGRKTFGRSVYLCRSSFCVDHAVKRNLIQKQLKCALPEGFAEKLKEETSDGA